VSKLRDNVPVLVVTGDWTIHTIAAIDADLRLLREHGVDRPRAVDVSQLQDFDTAGAFSIEAAMLSSLEQPATILGQHDVAARLLAEVRKYVKACDLPKERPSAAHELLERIGRNVVDLYSETVETLAFVGKQLLP
jgi:phospholipid/cholesterol/gamma-HCH transport system permease protein